MSQQTPSDPSENPFSPTVAIVGAGQMGLVMAGLLTDSTAPSSVRLWGHMAEEIGPIAQTRRSPRLPGFELPETVHCVIRDEELLAGADLIVSAVPVQATRAAWTRLAPHVPPGAGVVSVAKGIETETLLRPTQVIHDVLAQSNADDPDGPPRPYAALSGPTIAKELARRLPATMIAASDRLGFAELVQRHTSTSWMRIYTNTDLLGVELAGATKNVIALAAGIIDGLGAGFNAKSALLARGLAEIARLGSAMGASPETFSGIAGVGDLATTCFSPEGRNRTCGEALGRGVSLADYLAGADSVVEGVETTRAVVQLAQKYRVDMPITAAVGHVLFDGLDPVEAIGRLMSRQLKEERVG